MKHWVRAQINCAAGDATRLRRFGNAMNTVDGFGDALLDGHIGVDHQGRVLSAAPV